MLDCALPDVLGTSVDYAVDPGEGEALWILVRGESASGPMTFESLSATQVGLRDAEIAAGGACP